MRLLRLQLSDYRNIHRLDVSLPGRLGIFVGNNAEGKSNLLEAIYLLATMRALRAETDIQLVRREALDDPLPAARVVGEVETGEGLLKIEVTLVARPGSAGPAATKTVRVNGLARRLTDAVGRITAVLFTADDLEMIGGSPSLRRRYVDMTLAQSDPPYAAARSRYERVLTQRNHLLKRLREGQAQREEMAFWDTELAREGGLILQRRAAALAEMAVLAGRAHALLAPGEELAIEYRPRLEAEVDLSTVPPEVATEAFLIALGRGAGRDIAAGMTLQGPHRDDLAFQLNGLPAAGYASRAQQRTAALSLRLAEARFLTARRGEPPVLLLDDILSEMDAGRRRSVLSALGEVDQMLVTGTDWDRFPEDFSKGADLFAVAGGSVRPLSGPAGARTAD